jgi:hypothetical protein
MKRNPVNEEPLPPEVAATLPPEVAANRIRCAYKKKKNRNYSENLANRQADLDFIKDEAEKYKLVFPPAEQKRGWTWSFAFYPPAAMASWVCLLQILPYLFKGCLWVGLVSAYPVAWLRDFIRAIFFDTTSTREAATTVVVVVWTCLQSWLFKRAKTWLGDSSQKLAYMPHVNGCLHVFTFLSLVVGCWSIAGLMPSPFAHNIMQFLHCQQKGDALVSILMQANMRMTIFNLIAMSDEVEILFTHPRLANFPNVPKTTSLVCGIVMMKFVLWSTLDTDLRIEHGRNPQAGFQHLRVLDFMVMTPLCFNSLQWVVSCQQALPLMFMRWLPISDYYTRQTPVLYTVMVCCCQIIQPKSFTGSVITCFALLLNQNLMKSLWIQCVNLRKKRGPMKNHTDPSTSTVTSSSDSTGQKKRPWAHGDTLAHQLLLMPLPQFWWMKLIFGNKKELLGAQPWKEWNRIKCVCKPSDPDLLGWALMILSGGVILAQYLNQKREKRPLRWLLRNKTRFTVFVLVTVSSLCSWVGDEFETFLDDQTDEVLKFANTPWPFIR